MCLIRFGSSKYLNILIMLCFIRYACFDIDTDKSGKNLNKNLRNILK